MKQVLRMNLKHKYVYESRCFQLVYLKYWLYENAGFAFISVGYTITDLQKTETL